MPTSEASYAFQALTPAQQNSALRAYAGPNTRQSDFARIRAEIAANPTVAISVMEFASVGEGDSSGSGVDAVDATINRGDQGGRTTPIGTPPPDDQMDAPGIDDSERSGGINALPIAEIAGVMAAAEAARRMRSRNRGGSAGSVDPMPQGGDLATIPRQQIPEDFDLEGEFIAGERTRPVVPVPGREGVTIEGTPIRDPITGEFYIIDQNGQRVAIGGPEGLGLPPPRQPRLTGPSGGVPAPIQPVSPRGMPDPMGAVPDLVDIFRRIR